MDKITVNAGKAYDVLIGRDLIKDCGKLMVEQGIKPCKIMLVTDTNVEPLYASKVTSSLEDAGFEVYVTVIPAGERFKTITFVTAITDSLSEEGFTRSDKVVALGGGVIGDMAGFAAAIYQRGIDVIQMPTTLLSQVDASVGGKTGVDNEYGKNQIGAFHQPSLVILDSDVLGSLADDVYAQGMAEVIKYAFIKSRGLYNMLNENLITADSELLPEVIKTCVRIKADLVEEDEFDNGARQFLNFGHTFGHVIEKKSNFTVPHGFAVAKGMAYVTACNNTPDVNSAVVSMLKKYSLPFDDDITADELCEGVLNDKKKRGAKVTMVLVKEIGKVYLEPMTVEEIREFIGRK